jgi:hypothetical protein
MSPFYNSNSNDMLKNMLNLPSPTPRVDLMKAFDKKFQIPKLSARSKTDDKTLNDDSHPRSAPTTPSHALAPSPTLDYNRDIYQQKFFSNIQQQHQHQKYVEEQQRQKKLYKSASSEHLYDRPGHQNMQSIEQMRTTPSDTDFQAFLRAQAKRDNDMMNLLDANLMQNNPQLSGSIFNDNDDALNFNEL